MGVSTGSLDLFSAGSKLTNPRFATWLAALTALSSPMTSYAPTVSGVTLGTGGTTVAVYTQVGKWVEFRWVITLGTGGALSGALSVGLPVTALDAGWAGACFLFDASNSTNRQPGVLNGGTTTNQVFGSGIGGGGGGQCNATVPFTWAASDVIKGWGSYEAA